MIQIQAMLPLHAADVLAIYEEGLATGQATFTTQVPSWAEWDGSHLLHSRLVALEEERVLGWAALSAVSARHCYRGVAELSLYIEASRRGQGLGQLLLEHLIKESEANGIWTLQSSTFPENRASLRLQKRWGFREIGYRERIARLQGVWRNTLLLERRSPVVGAV
ncbi:GNAT family N-acetyltransferase [Cesiribacter andamanensis]|uniref:Putative phosphinothricin acetyltransferase YwnH n=1 Tax=Cesiribacter andamanensis AMV16 TaxID=1279009 RepID=M7NX25_9BACT|nr:GNAT family N-acetyltransferase [Cesiribacter andamanensis]EMR03004.1 Putative phosphinothricin acetyltransferase YwnH [Cesiribacter andamanensis AMV16]